MLPIEALAEDASAMPFAVCVEWAMMVKRFVRNIPSMRKY